LRWAKWYWDRIFFQQFGFSRKFHSTKIHYSAHLSPTLYNIRKLLRLYEIHLSLSRSLSLSLSLLVFLQSCSGCFNVESAIMLLLSSKDRHIRGLQLLWQVF
jgi:hypothetical protein